MNPPHTIICVLCKSAMPFYNRNPERFFRHLLADHCTYFNLNLLLEVSLLQPAVPNPGVGVSLPMSGHNITALENQRQGSCSAEPDSTSPSDDPLPSPVTVSGSSSLESTLSSSVALPPVNEGSPEEDRNRIASLNPSIQDMGDFDLSYFISNIVDTDSLESQSAVSSISPHSVNVNAANSVTLEAGSELSSGSGAGIFFKPALPHVQADFSSLDPISIVQKEPRPKRTKQPSNSLPENPNRHLVPEDLQGLIIRNNPSRSIKFTMSQRMNTQMVVDDYVLKKKKGPYSTRGGRVINWKCVNDTCQYTAVTWEGEIQDTSRQHNHPAQPELYIKKQARVKIRENIVNEKIQMTEDRPMSNLVNEVVNDTNNDVRDMIGSVDALKQAARRFNRKLQNKDTKPSPGQATIAVSSKADPSSMIVGVEDLSRYEVVGEFPVDLQFSLDIPSAEAGAEAPLVTIVKQEAVSGEAEDTEAGTDNIEELLETSPTKQDLVADELISDC